jgi:CelD/BcsL family acetyltransferase involved in cellulose biosynthesis
VSVAFITDTAAIEDAWWALWHANPAATPFQSPAWLLPWRTQFGGERSGVLVVRRGDDIAALLPLFMHEDRWLLWGAGTSDWLDGIYATGLAPDLLTKAIASLDAPLDLFQLPETSPLLRSAAPAGWSDDPARAASCIGLALPAELPRNIAQNLAYYRRRATRASVGNVERLGPDAFADLVDLHTRRWQEDAEPGVLADPRVLAWHRAALPQLEAAGMLRLYGLRQGGRLCGVLYVVTAHGRACYYIGGFDPELADLGLGTILVGHAIAEAELEGAHTFDFLRGQEPYKYRWGAADRPSYARMLSPP